MLPDSHDVIEVVFRRPQRGIAQAPVGDALREKVSDCRVKTAPDPIEFARCFLRLANLPNFALDRLSRYEATLWHQVGRILYAIETLDRCKPRERNGRSTIVSKMDFVD